MDICTHNKPEKTRNTRTKQKILKTETQKTQNITKTHKAYAHTKGN